jgi:hypothetical protein
MNFVFITKISITSKALSMQSESESFSAELEPSIPLKCHVRSLELFEEYSHRAIIETIKDRREIHEKADSQIRKEIEAKANMETSNFQTWLESVKNFTPQAAHYYSVSLKSLLMGLPTGLKIAQLFSAMLKTI